MAEHLNGALGDLRVLEVGGEVGAWCGKLLADMGADVVKVEPPGGDRSRFYGPFYQDRPDPNRSLYFWHYNTSKKGITLNLSSASGQQLFRRLIGPADVLLDSFPAGHLDGLGLGYDVLQKINPRLIMAAITPFGQQGPCSGYAATDLTVLAHGGPVWSCGYDDHSLPPQRGGGNQGYHTACHFAAISILVALTHRDCHGVGQFIDVNMHSAANVTTEAATYSWLVARETVERQTGRHASVRPTPTAQVQCRDGGYVNTGPWARNEEQYLILVAWLGEEGELGNVEEYLTAPARGALAGDGGAGDEQRRRVHDALLALAQRRDAYDLFRAAQERGLQWGIVYSPDEVLADPHFRARGFTVEVEHPELGTTFLYPCAPYRLGASPWAIRRRAPLLGEDNYATYVEELGLSPDDLVALVESGVV